ncbi:MAG: hypothetical protein WD850_01290 [Candidatus Spechtbacterales bacterium]
MVTQFEKERLLLDVVQEYIETATPVSSGGLLEKYGYDVSSATLRNWMAELSDAGFLMQPHTSAGRIPTPKAYRFFVDKVALGAREPVEESEAHKQKALPEAVRDELETALRNSPQEAAREMSRYLAEMSHAMGFAGLLGLNQFYREGLRRLLDEPEFLNTENVRRLVEFADSLEEEMEQVFRNLDEDVQIIIGSPEHPRREMPFSVMAFTSELPNHERAVFGIVGPMRMRYSDNLRLLEDIRGVFNDYE